MYRDVVDKVPFLKSADKAFVVELLPHLKPIRIEAGELILHQEWHSTELYFLIKGRACQTSRDGKETYRSLVQGSYFGDIAMFVPAMLNPNIRAVSTCELRSVSVNTLREILVDFAEMRRYMRKIALERCRRLDTKETEVLKNESMSALAMRLQAANSSVSDGVHVVSQRIEDLSSRVQWSHTMQSKQEEEVSELQAKVHALLNSVKRSQVAPVS